MLVNDGEMLDNDGEMLVNDGEINTWSNTQFTVISLNTDFEEREKKLILLCIFQELISFHERAAKKCWI